MSVSGFCEICQERDVEYTCDRCGKLVCDEHFDTSIGYCVECAAELSGGERDGEGADPDDLPDGVGTYRS
jgi:ribosomal protein L37AE/L43A